MKLGTIVTATDTNPLYMDFIPLFIRTWKHFVPEADVTIILIATEIPEQLRDYAAHIRLFPPVTGMHTAFQAQCIRLLWPRDAPRMEEGVLITDIDILPMQRDYYTRSIEPVSDDTFVCYRDVLLPSQLPMCYNVALPRTWTALFGTASAETIMRDWYKEYTGVPGEAGWYTDQIKLTEAFNAFAGQKCVLRDSDLGFKRLNRGQFRTAEETRRHTYVDYHALRPYNQYAAINKAVISYATSGAVT
jgi:hypothetical protein